MKGEKIGPWIASLLLMGSAAWPRPALAQGSAFQPRLGLVLSGGYAFPASENHSSHITFGGSFLASLSKNLVVEVGSSFSLISTDGQPESLGQGKLLHIPVTVNIRFRIPFKDFLVVPFLTAGGGYAFHDFQLDEDMVQGYQDLGFEISEACDGAGLLQAGAGLEMMLSPHISLEAVFRYRFCSAASQWSIIDSDTGNRAKGTVDRVNLNALAAGIGVRFFFN